MADCETVVEITPPTPVEADVAVSVVESDVAVSTVEAVVTTTVEEVEVSTTVVEVEVLGTPALVSDFLLAGEDIDYGELVTVDAAGAAVLAEAGFASDKWDAIGAAKSAGTTLAGAPLEVGTDAVRPVVMLFDVVPAAGDNGRLVFLSPTPGCATLTPPSGGNMLVVLGTLQGADGSNPTPAVRFRPQIVGRFV